MARSPKNIALRVMNSTLLILMLVVLLFPVAWTVATSLKTGTQSATIPPVWFFRPTLQNYAQLFASANVFLHLKNSVIIATSSALICIVFGSMAGYSLARFRFRGSRVIAAMFLIGRMIPPIVFVVPYFLIMRRLRLVDTHAAVVSAHVFFNITFVTFLMRSFFGAIPRELEQSALIDGCNGTQAFLHVTIPLATPGLATVGIFSFLYSWNEFVYALILAQSRVRTLSILAASFVTPEMINWSSIFATSVVVMTPMIILGLTVRKYFVRGLTFGAVKG